MTIKNDEAQHQLKRSLKPEWVFAMALGSAVGWGAFILPFDWLSTGGLGGTLIGFTIGGLIIGIIAVNYGTVIRALPVTGGGVAFALAALGRVHGFIAGWCLTLGYAGIVALNASAVTLVFRVTVPDLVMRMRLYSVAGWDIYLPEVVIALIFLLGFAWINIRGVEISGRFQFIAVVLMLFSVVAILIACVILFLTRGINLAPAFPPGVSPVTAIAVIVAFAPWAYVGFDSVPQLAGEFNFPPRKAMSLLIWGVVTATFIYMAMTVSTAIAVGNDYTKYGGTGWPPAEAIGDQIGVFGLILMVVSVSMGVLTGLNGFYTASSRVLLTMGRAKMVPQSFSMLHQKFKTPVVAILFTTTLCLITPLFGRAALSWIVDMTSVGITIAYFYTCYCGYIIGKKGFVSGMKHHQEPSLKAQILGVAGCILALGFLLLLLVPSSPGALGTESLIALLVWVALGLIFFLSRSKVLFSIPEEKIHDLVFSTEVQESTQTY
ncbi:cationic amino acid transporter [Corynebacterium glutamicum]|uniref:APC family permease n=1 Tax=Corynebacterium glutamicum TaxID=1718 RepID=UPI00097F3F71|nr:APC family permease [Corynebacterium glutamicum]SJM70323.1 cationic amino acid transporter [Corynebacterium glutamicum]